MQAEMRAAPHRHRGAEEHEPHERGARHLVVPDEGALEHVAREDPGEQIRADHGQEGDAKALHRPVEQLHLAAASTLSSHSLPTLAPISWYTGPIMSRKGLRS